MTARREPLDVEPPHDRSFGSFLASIPRGRNFKTRLPFVVSTAAVVVVKRGWDNLFMTLALAVPITLALAY